MNKPDEHYVFHGSHELFETAIPKRQIRKGKNQNGDGFITIFDDISFHATPYKWIAINYTCICQNVSYNGKEYWHNTGVSLKNYKEEIEVYGVESLEKSLEVLFGKGGYLFTFDNKDFVTQEGLGMLEVIAKQEVKPLSIERVDDPVSELKKLGITFTFIDMTLPENQQEF
jgi:hypothetical protein